MKIRVLNTGNMPSLFVGALLALLVVTGRHLDTMSETLMAQVGVLVLGWMVFSYLFAMVVNALFTYIHLKDVDASPQVPQGEDADLYQRYLRLRDRLIAIYEADPYEMRDIEEAYVPVDLVLPRHVYEKLMSWAEADCVSLSDMTGELAMLGMAQAHLMTLVDQSDWAEIFDRKGGSPWI